MRREGIKVRREGNNRIRSTVKGIRSGGKGEK